MSNMRHMKFKTGADIKKFLESESIKANVEGTKDGGLNEYYSLPKRNESDVEL